MAVQRNSFPTQAARQILVDAFLADASIAFQDSTAVGLVHQTKMAERFACAQELACFLTRTPYILLLSATWINFPELRWR